MVSQTGSEEPAAIAGEADPSAAVGSDPPAAPQTRAPARISAPATVDEAARHLERYAQLVEVRSSLDSGFLPIDWEQLRNWVAVEAEECIQVGRSLVCLVLALPEGAQGLRLDLGTSLEALAGFCRSRVRRADIVARHVQDAVVVLFPGENVAGGTIAANRLLRQWMGRRASERVPDPLCAGISVLGESVPAGEQLLGEALLASIEARRRGPGELVHFQAEGQPMAQPLTAPEHLQRLRERCRLLRRHLGSGDVRLALHHLHSFSSQYAWLDETHSWQVADRAVGLARSLREPQEVQQDVAVAALLRDLGMALVPGPVVAQPRALRPEERRLIESHPRESVRLGRRLPLRAGVYQAILHHHERCDGTGYPGGLKGDSIPLTARIVGLADAYESRQVSRPHRPAATPADALAWVESQAGTAYDSRLVTALARMS